MNSSHAPTTLVFTVALNGYHWRYGELIDSQRSYAKRCGYHYVCVSRPLINALGLETAWLKLSLALAALESGYDYVFYVDADARIQEHAPPLTNLIKADKHVYAARGYSGRINSGVLLFTNTAPAREKLSQILGNINRELPVEDDVGWGENGHMIHYLSNWVGFQELPPAWNNNHTADLPDFIRHYSAGPLRAEFQPPAHKRLPAMLTSKLANLLRRLKRLENNRATISCQLPILTASALQYFPELQAPTKAK